MSWLSEDPEVLNFVMDAVETWNESDVETMTSSDDTSEPPSTPHAITPSPVPDGPKKRRRNRTNRRQEILDLRAQATSLKATLQSLQQCAKPELESALAKWEQQARHELSYRRQAELKNVWLRATLARHVKITRRLTRLVHQLRNSSIEPPSFDHGSGLSELLKDDPTHVQPPDVTVEIHDRSPTDAVVIKLSGLWYYTRSAASIETALWTMFSADHLRVTQFAIDYEVNATNPTIIAASASTDVFPDAQIVSNDDTSIHASFTIHSQDGAEFQGRQLARCRRDEFSGAFVVTVTGQTLPLGIHASDVFADATLLEEESHFRVSTASLTSSALAIERRFRLHASSASGPHRLEIAQAIAKHLQEELQWMYNEVERRATLKGPTASHLCPRLPKEVEPASENVVKQELEYVL